MSKTELMTSQQYRDSQGKGKTKPTPERVTTTPPRPKKEPPPEMGVYFQAITDLGPMTRILGGTVEDHQLLHTFIQQLKS